MKYQYHKLINSNEKTTNRELGQILDQSILAASEEGGHRCLEHPGEHIHLVAGCGHGGDLPLETCV